MTTTTMASTSSSGTPTLRTTIQPTTSTTTATTITVPTTTATAGPTTGTTTTTTTVFQSTETLPPEIHPKYVGLNYTDYDISHYDVDHILKLVLFKLEEIFSLSHIAKQNYEFPSIDISWTGGSPDFNNHPIVDALVCFLKDNPTASELKQAFKRRHFDDVKVRLYDLGGCSDLYGAAPNKTMPSDYYPFLIGEKPVNVFCYF